MEKIDPKHRCRALISMSCYAAMGAKREQKGITISDRGPTATDWLASADVVQCRLLSARMSTNQCRAQRARVVNEAKRYAPDSLTGQSYTKRLQVCEACRACF